jgi:hypothetical protein
VQIDLQFFLSEKVLKLNMELSKVKILQSIIQKERLISKGYRAVCNYNATITQIIDNLGSTTPHGLTNSSTPHRRPPAVGFAHLRRRTAATACLVPACHTNTANKLSTFVGSCE